MQKQFVIFVSAMLLFFGNYGNSIACSPPAVANPSKPFVDCSKNSFVRMWSSKLGKQIYGSLLKSTESSSEIVLKRYRDGKEFQFSIEKLAKEDQAYVRREVSRALRLQDDETKKLSVKVVDEEGNNIPARIFVLPGSTDNRLIGTGIFPPADQKEYSQIGLTEISDSEIDDLLRSNANELRIEIEAIDIAKFKPETIKSLYGKGNQQITVVLKEFSSRRIDIPDNVIFNNDLINAPVIQAAPMISSFQPIFSEVVIPQQALLGTPISQVASAPIQLTQVSTRTLSNQVNLIGNSSSCNYCYGGACCGITYISPASTVFYPISSPRRGPIRRLFHGLRNLCRHCN